MKIKEKATPFVPVNDPPEIVTDPVSCRVLALFDALRRRNVGPERAAYCVSQVFGSASNGGSHPRPQ